MPSLTVELPSQPGFMERYGILMLDHGFRTVPIKHGTKRPVGANWNQRDFAAEIRAGKFGECGIGVIADETPWIDVDVLDSELADAFHRRIDERFEHNGTIAMRVGLAPKFAIPCRTTSPFTKITSKYFRRPNGGPACRIEILGCGQQAVAYGIHPGTMRPYEWNGVELFDLKVPDLPAIDRTVATAIVIEFETLAEEMGFVRCDAKGNPSMEAKGTTLVARASIASKRREMPRSESGKASTAPRIINIAEVYSALLGIGPGLEYDQWVRVGMALHSADPAIDGEGFDLWNRWSARGDNYPGSQALRDKWATFSADGGVTIKSLFALAHLSGWNGNYLLDESGREYIDQQNQRRLIDFNHRHGVVFVGGETRFASRVYNDALGRWETRFSRLADIRAFYEHVRLYEPVVANAGQWTLKDKSSVVDAWRRKPTRRAYPRGVEFRPVPGLVIQRDWLPNGDVLNLYTGLGVVPLPGDCQPILDHISMVWCGDNSDLSDYVLNWLAQLFQRPGEPGHTVLVLLSGEGAGKGIVVDALVKAMGAHGISVARHEDVTGAFNSHIAESVLVILNESTYGGDKRVAGQLKSLITDPLLAVNRKFMPIITVKNCCHLIVSSNENWAVPVGLDDRRFLVLELSEARRNDFAYFATLAANIDGGGLEAFVHYLLNRDINQFNPRVMPNVGTRKADMKMRSTDSFTRWLADCLIRGEIPIWSESGHMHEMVLTTESWSCDDVFAATDKLFDAYRSYCARFELRGASEYRTTFGKRLTTAPIGAARQSRRDSGGRVKGYLLPTLLKARDLFQGVVGPMDDFDDGPVDA